MQVLAGTDNLSKILGSNSLIQTAFFLQDRIKLTFSAILKDQVEVIIIFVVIVKLYDILVVQVVHDLHF
jgi:hypothetical protein